MPNNEGHAQNTYSLYGIFAFDFHQWIDAPSKTHGRGHRRFRHDSRKPPPLSAIEKYGYYMARKLQIAHFKLDGVHWGSAPELPIWQEGNWIYKRMPNGRTYKKQLNGKPRSSQRPKRTTVPHVFETTDTPDGWTLTETTRRQATDEEGLEIIKSIFNQVFKPNSTVRISVSIEPQPKPRHIIDSGFTCPRCEGAVEVTYEMNPFKRQYPTICVHCGYSLRGACLVASQRKKE